MSELDELGENRTVLVVGGNLTAIETATEIAESRPELQVALATTGEATRAVAADGTTLSSDATVWAAGSPSTA